MINTASTVWYCPGSWLVVVGPACAVALEASPQSAAFEAWARAITSGADVDELLALAAEHDPAAPASFAIVAPRAADVRLVLRGDARLWCADGRELSADGAPGWRDGVIDLASLPVRVGDPRALSTPVRLPLSGGVVLASTFDLYPAEVPPAAARAGTTPAGRRVDPGVPSVAVVPPPPVVVEPPHVSPPPTVLPAEPAEPAAAAEFAHLFAPSVVRRPPAPDPAAGSPDDTLFPRPEIVEPVEVAPPAPVATVGPGVRSSPPAPAPGGIIDAVPWAPGGTTDQVAHPGSSAPFTAEAPELPAATVAPAVPAAQAAQTVPADTDRPTPTTESWWPSLPPTSSPPEPAALQAVAPAPEPGDTDDHTVARSSLAAVAGPTVLAAYCPAGHLSPVHAQYCRVCDLPIAPNQAPMTIPRPTLGLLRLPGGQTIALDRGVLLGRSPSARELPPGEQQHVVSLASPEKDISRNHLEIRLDGWHVLALDLGSVNGTVVVLPGRQPQRLRPEEPVILERGATVTLADEVSLVFEVPA